MAAHDNKARNVAILAVGVGMVGVLTSMSVIFPRIDPTFEIAYQAAEDTSPFVDLEPTPSPPHPLSIALLPMATEPGAEVPRLLMEELARDVTQELGGLGLRVADDRATQALRGETRPHHEQGRVLGVRYVLATTLGGTEDDLRVHATLTDCTTKRVLWKGTFFKTRRSSDETDREIAFALRTVLPLDRQGKGPEEW
jgi:TolB-like protein